MMHGRYLPRKRLVAASPPAEGPQETAAQPALPEQQLDPPPANDDDSNGAEGKKAKAGSSLVMRQFPVKVKGMCSWAISVAGGTGLCSAQRSMVSGCRLLPSTCRDMPGVGMPSRLCYVAVLPCDNRSNSCEAGPGQERAT
jgi:hypothetical protein